MIRKNSTLVTLVFLISGIMILSSCSQETFSSRKYQHLDYVKVKPADTQDQQPASQNASGQNADMNSLSASSVESPMIAQKPLEMKKNFSPAADQNKNVEGSSKSILKNETKGSKALEKVESMKNLNKSELKNLAAPEGKLSGLDQNLRLAIIFGVIGLVMLIIGGALSFAGAGALFVVIGSVAFIIGLVFLLIYLLE